MLVGSLLGAEVVVGPAELEIGEPLIDLRLGTAGGRLVADRHRAVLRLPAVATFAIERGRRVAVEPVDGVAAGVVDAWLRATVAALVLAQRKRFALHANLIDVGGSAVAVTGDRGAGKTTTSLALAQRGHRVLGDDVLPLDVDAGEVTHVTTGRPLHVGPETASALGLDLTAAEPADLRGRKRLLPQPTVPPGPLDHIVVLREAPVEEVEHEHLSGAAAVRAVLSNAYRARLLQPVWGGDLFTWASAVAGAAPVHMLQRPAGRWSGEEVAAAVEAIADAR